MSELALQLIEENKRTRSPKLDLGNCGLTEIPEEVFELEWLEELHLGNEGSQNMGQYNTLKGVSKKIANLNNLTSLHYCGSVNNEYALDDFTGITELKNLNNLFLSHTSISDITGISNLQKLNIALLSNTKITDISPLESIKDLVAIDIGHTKVNKLDGLEEIENLYWLKMQGLSEVDISKVCDRGQLIYLNILGTKLTSYNSLSSLGQLEELEISHLPPDDFIIFKDLKKLKKLKIYDISTGDGRQYLTFLPKEIVPPKDTSHFNHLSNLQNLEELEMSLLFFEDPICLKAMSQLKELSIHENSISDISAIGELKSLETFGLSVMNPIEDYSPIGKLERLVNLKLSRLLMGQTNVSNISWIKKLSNLETVIIKGTITNISPLKNFNKITNLNLGGNKIKDISALSNLNRLKTLVLSGNPIDNIDVIMEMQDIAFIFLDDTKISHIEPLSNLNNLEWVNIERTSVKNLKPLIGMLRKGAFIEHQDSMQNVGIYIPPGEKNIFVHETPIEQPPLEIIQQGSDAVVRYFEQLEKEGFDYIYEAKLLIIGEGGAGKTSLCRKLFDPEAALPGEEESTKGVVVEPLYFDLQDGRKFRLNIWDFAGQGKYQAAHSFFYTHRSLYVLVDDTRAFDKDETYRTYYDYWLQTAHLFGGDSPLLVLHNQKADRVRTGFNIGSFQAEFPFVKELFQINLGGKEVQHIIDLRRQIERWATKLPHVGDRVPKSWVLVREDTEEERRKHPYISYDRYLEICANRGIEDEAVQSDLSSYFHDLGVFLHYKNDPLLRRDVFLQNEWVMDAVYKILDDPEIAGPKRGRFNKADLTRVWSEGLYPKRRDELLALMQQFELCYPIQDTEDHIAPQMLPGEIPDYSLGEELPLQLRYKYGFMPKGLLHRLIVRLHRYIAQEQSAVWNTGVVLKRKSAIAEIVESLDRRSIAVKATGQDTKELITIIHHEMEKLHALPAFRARLKVETQIPCNCGVCRETDQAHFFDYDDLERRKKRGKETAECLKSYDNVPVQQLLDGVFAKMPQPNGAQRTVKIFLASSSELAEDRKEFEIFINRENKNLRNKGLFIDLVLWEDFLDAVSATRLQDEYNKALRDCDIVVCMFYTKVGKYTAEEFDAALGHFRETGKPHIFTYFKDAPAKPSELRAFNTVLEFKNRLSDLGHFPSHYESLGDLKHHFGEQLKKLGIG